MSKIAKLFANAGVENAELMAAIEQAVETAGSRNTDIPVHRFNAVIKERNDLRAEVAELNVGAEGFNTKITDYKAKLKEAKGYKTELDDIKHKQFKEQREHWITKSKVFNVEDDDKTYERIKAIKDDFIFHEKINEYTAQEVAHNILMLKPYEKINYFGKPAVPDPKLDGSRGTGDGKNNAKDPLDL